MTGGFVSASDFARAMNAKGKAFRKDVTDALDDAGEHMVGLAQLQAKGRGVQDRSGRLAASFRHSVEGSDAGGRMSRVLSIVSAGVPYAGVQESGAVVTPKRAKFLTVPLDDAKTAKGVVRGRARMFDRGFFVNLGKRPNTPQDMRPFGSIFLVERRPNGALSWLFQLRKRVEVKGRLGFFDTWREKGAPFLRRKVRFAVAKALEAK